jgi:hypothetical protein
MQKKQSLDSPEVQKDNEWRAFIKKEINDITEPWAIKLFK